MHTNKHLIVWEEHFVRSRCWIYAMEEVLHRVEEFEGRKGRSREE
jgi:hypothetical protein